MIAPLLVPCPHAAVVTIDGIRWRVVRMIDAYRAVLIRPRPTPAPLSPVDVCVARFERKPTLTRAVCLLVALIRDHGRPWKTR